MKIFFAAALLAASFSAQADGPTYCGAGTECTILHSGTTTFTLPSGTNTAATISSTQMLDNKKVGLQSGTTGAPSLFFESSTNTGASLVSGNVFSIDVLGYPTMEFGSFGTAVNFWLAQPGSTGNNVQLSAKGTDTNVGVNFIAQGTGNLYFAAAGVTQFNIPGIASAANYFQPSAATAGNSPQLQVLGTDTNIGIELKTKAAGVVDTPVGYTAGVNGTTTGTLGLANGGSSGAYTTVQPSAVTSATTITLPASSGTLALASGTITTATNVAGGAPNDIVIQTGAGTTGFVTPVNGAVLNTNSSGVPSETVTPVIGVNASVTGTLGLANGGASGATTTIQPAAVTSAITVTLPSQTGTVDEAASCSLATGSTVDIGATCSSGSAVTLTGTGNTITSFGSTAPVGAKYRISFPNTTTITNSANLNLPRGVSISTGTNSWIVECWVQSVVGTWYCGLPGYAPNINMTPLGSIITNGTMSAAVMNDTGLAASSAVCTDGSKNLSTTCGTTGGSGSVSATNFSPGLLTSITNTYSHFRQWTKASTVKNMIAAAMSLTCATNPTVTLYECGTSTTCAAPTTLASVQVTAAGTATPATLSATAIAAGDYTAWAISAGTCTTVDVNGVAEAEQN